nr:MAG TPA: Receptor Binding Protein [Caudoviricetes sp.]
MAAEKYFPFRSVSGDRKYSAEDWAAYFALFLSNGVFYSSADRLKVTAYEGMKVKVGKGAGFIAGRMYMLEADTTITLDTADGALNRIDRIVLRCDYTNRRITIAVKKGSYSASPTAPELTRDADAYELALADVYVAAGVVTITTANITDQRLNTALCGIVTGLVEQADTQEIFDEFYAYLQEFKQTTQVDIEAWTLEQQQAYITWYTQQQEDFANWYNTHTTAWQQEFNTWFDEVQGMLEGDVATNLTNRVIKLEERATALESNKAERVLLDEDQVAAGEEQPQGFSLFIKNGALCVRRVV